MPKIYSWILFPLIFLFPILNSADISIAEDGSKIQKPGKDKGASLDASGESLEFGVLDTERHSYTIQNIKVQHDGIRSVTVHISATGIRHEESNVALNPEKWLKITPVEGISSPDNPFLFNIRVQLPKDLSGLVQDGLYTGRVKIESEDAESPIFIPLRFTVNLPDFVPVPPDIVDTGISVPISCCLPAQENFSIELRPDENDVLNDIAVKVVAPMNIVMEESGNSVPESQMLITNLDSLKIVDLIVYAGTEPTNIPMTVQVNNPAMPAGTYEATIAIRGEFGRTLYVPVSMEIAEKGAFLVDRIRIYLLIALAILALMFFARPGRMFLTRRNRFLRNRFKVTRKGVPSTWNRYFSAVPSSGKDRVTWRISASGGTRFSKRGLPRPSKNIVLDSPSRFTLTDGNREQYELSASSVTNFVINFRVTRSPYRISYIVWEGLLYSLSALFVTGFLCFPPLLCRLLSFIN